MTSFPAPAGAPRRGNRLTRGFGALVLHACGFRVEGVVPELPKAVVVAAPHTANRDIVVALAAKVSLGVHVHWLGKHTVFWPPLGWLLRWLGGVPVDRRGPHGTVAQAIALFGARDQLLLGMSPEGTRRRVERWKTGFHHIATGARVPIIPIALDYGARAVRIYPPVTPTADAAADVDALQRLYSPAMAKYPERYAADTLPRS
jgi:1-acyl-sn-glycerol-3-phosphate acyltransferase